MNFFFILVLLINPEINYNHVFTSILSNLIFTDDHSKIAYLEKSKIVKEYFQKKSISYPPENLLIRVFKNEKIMEIWARSKANDVFTHIIDYEICKSSGALGRKKREGDYQVPEGFYHIIKVNNKSKYYLSFEINYPNGSDKLNGEKNNLGGNICIHGDCVTIGCIPITDDKIKELWVMTLDCMKKSGNQIPVHIFPFRMESENIIKFNSLFRENNETILFWSELSKIYEYFKTNRSIPNVQIDEAGRYFLK